MLPFLISSIDSPNQKAFFTDLYQRYCPIMRHQVYKLMGEMLQADDLVQEAFVRLIGKYNTLRKLDEPQLVFYIVKTVRSVTINALQASAKREMWSITWADDPVSELPNQDTPEQTLLRRERQKELSDAVGQLPQAAQDLLYFKYILELSNEVLAKQYGTSQENIRQRLCRARRELLRRMGGVPHD